MTLHAVRPTGHEYLALVTDLLQRRRLADQPLHHGGSGEQRHARPAGQQGGDLVAVDAAGVRHHAHRSPGHVGQPVQPRAVRQRRGVQDAVLRHHLVDIGEVAERGHEQVAVGERRSLGLSGRAARVEQPGRISRLPVDERRRCRPGEPVPPRSGRQHRHLQRIDGADQRLDLVGVLVVGHDDRRAAVVEDVGDLLAVEPGVDRHGDETGVPDGEQRLEVLGRLRITMATRSPGDSPTLSRRPAAAAAVRAAIVPQLACTRSPSARAGSSGRRRPWRSTHTATFIAPPGPGRKR